MKADGTCERIMTRDPVCCLPDDTVNKAAQTMKREGVGSVPVVEDMESRKLVGILTDRDIAVEVVAMGHDPARTVLRDVMSEGLVTCRPEDEVGKALTAMTENQLRRIPVVDEKGCLCGIIAQADVATRLHAPKVAGEVLESVSR